MARIRGSLLVLFVAIACGAPGEGADEATGKNTTVSSGQAASRGGGRERTPLFAQPLRKVPIRVGSIEVSVEIADSPAARSRGLMFRESLPEDEGMLFVFAEEGTLSFWMRNTRIPLDIAFIDREGRIVDIQHMEPETEEMHLSRKPAMYALEMRKGWFADRGISEGDRVAF